MGEYTTVRVPKELADEIDELLESGYRGFQHRSEFTRSAIRRSLDSAQCCGEEKAAEA